MIEALVAQAKAGIWAVGFFSVVFAGLTILAAAVKLGSHFSKYLKG